MEYKGVSVEEMYKLWVDNQEMDKKRAEAGRLWDAAYREKHREERNRKAREYYQRKKDEKINKTLEESITQYKHRLLAYKIL